MSDTAATQAEELDRALGADSETVFLPFDGDPQRERRGVEIRPLKLKQLSQVLKCINELADSGVSLTGNFNEVTLLLTGGDVAIKLIAIASGEPVEVIEKLELDDAAAMAGAIYRVNKTFFQKKGATILAALGIDPAVLDQLKAKVLPGLKSSEPSSPTATA
jgi:hypothetical protein